MIDSLATLIVFVVVLAGPISILYFWRHRPFTGLFAALILLLTILILKESLETVAPLIKQNTNDPQVIAGVVSQAIVSSVMQLIVCLPILSVAHWLIRRQYITKITSNEPRLDEAP